MINKLIILKTEKKEKVHPVLKPCRWNQATPLQPGIDVVIPAGHLVRLVDKAIGRLSIHSIL